MPSGSLVDRHPASASSAAARRGTWPLPALAAWAVCWGVYALQSKLEAPLLICVASGVACGAVLSVIGSTPWRRIFIALGFPLSLLAVGGATALPAWAWLLPLALLALAYPLNAWRDAPFFPTPRQALDGLERLAPLPEGAKVLDAGCGLGHGLAALRRAYPRAGLSGVEWSRPLALLARWRSAAVAAEVRRGDMWSASWSGHAMVYLFQRPESMPRAVAKAAAELAPGAWLASLEFEAPALKAQAVLDCPDGRKVWLYRVPFVAMSAAAHEAPANRPTGANPAGR